MATQTVLTLMQEYLQTSYSPDMDFVDGHLEERNVGEHEHARLQWLIAKAFSPREDEWDLEGVIEQRIRVDGSRVRICDVALLRSDAPFERVIETPPFLCIEILSREDRLSRAKIVLEDYWRMGVKHIWLLDPHRDIAYVFDDAGLHEAEDVLQVPGTEMRLDYHALFARFQSVHS
ncbi:Uma2 family endonuclease [Terriglobus sp.]|uniref:Uma2 family endonuclease n=1 Tax=Terriglobus sp. TaxID=1889013 RepID=UPI003AFF7EF6